MGFAGVRLTDVAQKVGLDFRQGAFRYGVTADPPAMMGGGACWLDYDGDGWLDLFVVNSYGEGDIGGYGANGRHAASSSGTTTDSGSRRSYEAPPTRGEGCVAADLNGDGRTDLYVTTRAERRAALEQRRRQVHRGGPRRRASSPSAGTPAPRWRT